MPHLTLMGELWGVYCEDLGENWLRYSDTALYIILCIHHDDVMTWKHFPLSGKLKLLYIYTYCSYNFLGNRKMKVVYAVSFSWEQCINRSKSISQTLSDFYIILDVSVYVAWMQLSMLNINGNSYHKQYRYIVSKSRTINLSHEKFTKQVYHLWSMKKNHHMKNKLVYNRDKGNIWHMDITQPSIFVSFIYLF